MKRKSILLLSVLLLAGCSSGESSSVSVSDSGSVPESNHLPSIQDSSMESIGSETKPDSSVVDSSVVDSSVVGSSSMEESIISSTVIEIVTPEDYDATSNTVIHLGDTITVDNNNGGVFIDGSIVTIATAGSYDLSGTLSDGQVIVEATDEDAVTLNLLGMDITCTNGAPILILSADECSVSAKTATENFIHDLRPAESETYTGALYAMCDLELKGKGSLTVDSSFNNGIHTKDDLTIKNLKLSVTCPNNAIKGNDSLTVESGTITAISTKGDALKTSNSDLSSKGKQRGTITISGGTLNLYAACDCVDAAYDVLISGEPEIHCYSDKYSTYSEEVTAVAEKTLYLKTNTNSLSNSRMAVYFTLEDGTNVWKDATKMNAMGGSRTTYFELDMPDNASYLQVFSFTSSQSVNSLTDYQYASERLTVNTANDCLSLSVYSNGLNCSWTNYTTMAPGGAPGGRPGGMDEGNTDKADYSCKGIKADNQVTISGGTIEIKAHDDAIHANNDNQLETGEYGVGNVTISGGTIEITTDDDGIHADNELNITGGFVDIQKSYEGIEGWKITLDGGETRIISSDDGVNAAGETSQGDPYLYIKSGILYLNANGDGLDSNGYIQMSGGYVLAEGPTNGGNGVLDFDRSFTFTGGYLLAIGCSGMNQKPTASGTGVFASSKNVSTNTSSYVKMTVDSETKAIIKVNKSSQNYCAYAYTGTTGSVDVVSSITEALVDDLYYIA